MSIPFGENLKDLAKVTVCIECSLISEGDMSKILKTGSLFGIVWFLFSIFTGVMSLAKFVENFVYWKGFMEYLLVLYTNMFYWVPNIIFDFFNIKLPDFFTEYYAIGFLFSLSLFELFRIRAVYTEENKMKEMYFDLTLHVKSTNPLVSSEEIIELTDLEFKKRASGEFLFSNWGSMVKFMYVPIIAVFWPLSLFGLLSQNENEDQYFGLLIFYRYILLYTFILGSIVITFDVSDY